MRVHRLVLAAIVLFALLLRVVPAYDHVMGSGRVIFAGNDPWIHMRNVDNVAAHWPWPSWFDPYRVAPEGQVTEAPMMDVAIAGIALATTLPLDVVGAWFPAIAGALIPIPIFLLMRRRYGLTEALIAASLVAIMPGQLLARSMFGHTDHHVLEALLTATVLLFLGNALDRQSRRDAVLAGVVLGLFLLTWTRGTFFVFILLAWGFVEAAWSTRPLDAARGLALPFAIALAMAGWAGLRLEGMALNIPVIVGGLAGLAAAGWLMTIVQRRALAVASLVVLIAAGAAAALFLLPDLAEQLQRLTPSPGGATIGEARPMLWPRGEFTLAPLWSEFTTAAILAIPGLVLLARAAFRDGPPSSRLLLVWSVAVIAASLAQTRFSYYMALAVAMLAAVAAARWLWRGLDRVVAAIAVAAIVIYPNGAPAAATASAQTGALTAAWLETLDWMRSNTQEPFGSPDVYFQRFISPADAPQAAYSVMTWWDYAWWVTRVARRPPATNPTQTAVKEAARFYLATDEASALAILAERRARYVIADRSMPMSVESAGHAMASQLEVMARWSEQDEPGRFFNLYYERGRPVFLYTADYYRTMAIRLFAYGGRGYTPSKSTYVVSTSAREVTASRQFDTYGEAEEFMRANPGTWQIAGRHPLLSPVPIEPLTRITREYASSQGVDGPIGRIPEVAVFSVK